MIVLAIIGIIVAIAFPAFISSRNNSQAKACQENQAKLAGAVQEYILSKNSATVPDYKEIIGPGLQLAKTPTCPTGDVAIALPVSPQARCVCPTNTAGHDVK